MQRQLGQAAAYPHPKMERLEQVVLDHFAAAREWWWWGASGGGAGAGAATGARSGLGTAWLAARTRKCLTCTHARLPARCPARTAGACAEPGQAVRIIIFTTLRASVAQIVSCLDRHAHAIRARWGGVRTRLRAGPCACCVHGSGLVLGRGLSAVRERRVWALRCTCKGSSHWPRVPSLCSSCAQGVHWPGQAAKGRQGRELWGWRRHEPGGAEAGPEGAGGQDIGLCAPPKEQPCQHAARTWPWSACTITRVCARARPPQEFREGSVHVLVATCIGEEGLDIPEVRQWHALGSHGERLLLLSTQPAAACCHCRRHCSYCRCRCCCCRCRCC